MPYAVVGAACMDVAAIVCAIVLILILEDSGDAMHLGPKNESSQYISGNPTFNTQ